MRQNCWMAAAFTLTAPLARRPGAVRPAANGQGREAAVLKTRRYTLADLVEHPAILVEMRCWDGDRESLEPLLETAAPRENRLPAVASRSRSDFSQ